MPLLVHAVPGPLRRHREAVELAGQTDGEVGDVDHLLDLALALGVDLAHLQRDQRAERLLVLAQRIADAPDVLATLRGGQHAPLFEGIRGLADHDLVVGKVALEDRGNRFRRRRVLAHEDVTRRLEPAAGEHSGVGVGQTQR